MPRDYKCRKCGIVHAPPTGKHCRNLAVEEATTNDEGTGQILAALGALKTQMDDYGEQMLDVGQRLRTIEDIANNVSESASQNTETNDSTQGAEAATPQEQSPTEEQITPSLLRENSRIMTQAANRLASLKLDDFDDDELQGIAQARNKGRKSGSLMLASDTVERRIDWPHLYVRRMVDGRRRSVPYTDLRVEEFV